MGLVFPAQNKSCATWCAIGAAAFQIHSLRNDIMKVIEYAKLEVAKRAIFTGLIKLTDNLQNLFINVHSAPVSLGQIDFWKGPNQISRNPKIAIVNNGLQDGETIQLAAGFSGSPDLCMGLRVDVCAIIDGNKVRFYWRPDLGKPVAIACGILSKTLGEIATVGDIIFDQLNYESISVTLVSRG